MTSLLVTATKAEAVAAMRWGRLDPDEFQVIHYGQEIEKIYLRAVLVRPAGDITDEMSTWVSHRLKPRILGTLSTFGDWRIVVQPPLQITDQRYREVYDQPRAVWT